jgi:hypothetical protein
VISTTLVAHELAGHTLATLTLLKAAGINHMPGHMVVESDGSAVAGVRAMSESYGLGMVWAPEQASTVAACGPLAAMVFDAPELRSTASPSNLAALALEHHPTASPSDREAAALGNWHPQVLELVCEIAAGFKKHEQGIKAVAAFAEKHRKIELSLSDVLRLSVGAEIEMREAQVIDTAENLRALLNACLKAPHMFSQSLRTAATAVVSAPRKQPKVKGHPHVKNQIAITG